MSPVLETDDNGKLTVPAELLGGVKPHTRYVLETRGEKLILFPERETPARPKRSRKKKTRTPEEWMKEWRAWSEQVTKAWKSDKSAAEIISEMRR